MASQSALINVMQKASIYASKGLLRDFGEVENLQVSRKGPADFVSRADINAEKTIRRELAKARPDWGFLMEEGGVIEEAIPRRRSGSSTRSTAPPTSFTASRISRFPSRSWKPTGRADAASPPAASSIR